MMPANYRQTEQEINYIGILDGLIKPASSMGVTGVGINDSDSVHNYNRTH